MPLNEDASVKTDEGNTQQEEPTREEERGDSG